MSNDDEDEDEGGDGDPEDEEEERDEFACCSLLLRIVKDCVAAVTSRPAGDPGKSEPMLRGER